MICVEVSIRYRGYIVMKYLEASTWYRGCIIIVGVYKLGNFSAALTTFLTPRVCSLIESGCESRTELPK